MTKTGIVAWFLGRMISSNISVSWGFVDQVTDNIQIEKKRKILTYFHPEWFLYQLIVTASSYEWPTVLNAE